jgi:gas vesicle protein
MANNRSSTFLGGMILGAAVGTIAGLLSAPRSGRETRKLLKKSADALPELAEDLSATMQVQADRLSESALRNWDGTLGKLREAIAAGLEAAQREQQLLKRDPDSAANLQPSSRDRAK